MAFSSVRRMAVSGSRGISRRTFSAPSEAALGFTANDAVEKVLQYPSFTLLSVTKLTHLLMKFLVLSVYSELFPEH